MSEKKTPFYDAHVAAGGKIVPFAGYLLPVEYEGAGLITEHEAVRNDCGVFDVSHMGEITFKGPDALKALNHLLCNNYTTMDPGRCRYSPMCYEDGGCVDDLIVSKIADDDYFVVVNAANKDKDFAWMKEQVPADWDVEIEDVSDSYAQLALQGPKAQAIMEELLAADQIPEKNYSFIDGVEIAGVSCMLARTGYTGEDGFEIYIPAEAAQTIWDALMAAGESHGLIPCGLGARDTLRLEAAMPLYGHEMDETVSPLEAGLGWAVKMDKDDFIGKAALEAAEPARERIGLEVTGRGIVREHCDIFKGDEKIGESTSGTHLPHLKKACAMALVEKGVVAEGDELEADVRGRRVAVKVIPLPFYKRAK